jgi:hypothetical protein
MVTVKETALSAGDLDHVEEADEFSVLKLVERLSESVGGHVYAGHVIEQDVAVIVLVFSVLVVVIDVLCTLIMAVLADYVVRREVVSVQL